MNHVNKWLLISFCLILVVIHASGEDIGLEMKSVGTGSVKVTSHEDGDGPRFETKKLDDTIVDATDQVKIEQIKLDPKTNKFSTYKSPELKR